MPATVKLRRPLTLEQTLRYFLIQLPENRSFLVFVAAALMLLTRAGFSLNNVSFILSDISGLVSLPLKKNMLSGKSSFRVCSRSDLTARDLKLSSEDRRIQILKVKEIGH